MSASSALTPVPSLSRQEFWQRHVAQWQSGELSQRNYCREHDLIYHQFGYWKRQLLGADTALQDTTAQNHAAFVPVAVPGCALDSSMGLSIVLPNGVRIHGITDACVSTAAALVRQL
jgi:hypothetical protein